MMRIKATSWLLGILTLTPLGCQEKLQFAPVEGTVTKQGKPLADVIVDFYPDPGTPGPRSTSAPTDEAGHYRLRSTRNGDEGAAVGIHRVCIHDAGNRGRHLLDRLPKKAPSPKEIREKMKQVKVEGASSPRVSPIYGRPHETPLRVEVKPGPQVIDLEVK